MTAPRGLSPLLDSVRVLEVGGRGAEVCGRLFGELGADVVRVPTPGVEPAPERALIFDAYKRSLELDLLDGGDREPFEDLFRDADLLVVDLPFRELFRRGLDPDRLRALNPRAVVAVITPFGLTGSHREYRGSDLVAFHSSGIARLLMGHVEDLEAEPPVRAAGEQAGFISGLTAACAAMHALYGQQRHGAGELIDVSEQEALSLMAARELAMPGFGGVPAPRGGAVPGGGAVISVLPAADGHIAVSPREAHQWERWLGVLDNPEWGADPRFATRAGRHAHFDELYELMASWSRHRTTVDIFDACQRAHVPCFPFAKPGDMLELPQLEHRRFFVSSPLADSRPVRLPRPPFGPGEPVPAPVVRAGGEAIRWRPRAATLPVVTTRDAPRLPLEGVRVLDLSWVIAGPTSTRYLALMGAEVVKLEAPDRPDTGRVSELHDVLGQSKLGLALDLKADGALDALRRLIARSDVVVENFATGVMERLGIGYGELRAIRPDIILLSASGLGRTGPDARQVAYGNLLSAYSGFASRNGFRGREPRTGLAWADPLCGLLMSFAIVAALRDRDRGGGGRHIDFSMLEALLWTMPEELVRHQIDGGDGEPAGNADVRFAPHGVYRCAGDDRWLAIAVTDDEEWRALCFAVPSLSNLESLNEDQRRAERKRVDALLGEWAASRDAIEAMNALQTAGVPASASYSTTDLFADAHLWERNFYRPVVERDGTERFLPGLPWRWGDGSLSRPRAAPALGEHSEQVLREIAELPGEEIARLRSAGALGPAGS